MAQNILRVAANRTQTISLRLLWWPIAIILRCISIKNICICVFVFVFQIIFQMQILLIFRFRNWFQVRFPKFHFKILFSFAFSISLCYSYIFFIPSNPLPNPICVFKTIIDGCLIAINLLSMQILASTFYPCGIFMHG